MPKQMHHRPASRVRSDPTPMSSASYSQLLDYDEPSTSAGPSTAQATCGSSREGTFFANPLSLDGSDEDLSIDELVVDDLTDSEEREYQAIVGSEQETRHLLRTSPYIIPEEDESGLMPGEVPSLAAIASYICTEYNTVNTSSLTDDSEDPMERETTAEYPSTESVFHTPSENQDRDSASTLTGLSFQSESLIELKDLVSTSDTTTTPDKNFMKFELPDEETVSANSCDLAYLQSEQKSIGDDVPPTSGQSSEASGETFAHTVQPGSDSEDSDEEPECETPVGTGVVTQHIDVSGLDEGEEGAARLAIRGSSSRSSIQPLTRDQATQTIQRGPSKTNRALIRQYIELVTYLKRQLVRTNRRLVFLEEIVERLTNLLLSFSSIHGSEAEGLQREGERLMSELLSISSESIPPRGHVADRATNAAERQAKLKGRGKTSKSN